MGLFLLSGSGIMTSCASSQEGDMHQYKGKKSQKVRYNYKVTGYGDAAKAKKR